MVEGPQLHHYGVLGFDSRPLLRGMDPAGPVPAHDARLTTEVLAPLPRQSRVRHARDIVLAHTRSDGRQRCGDGRLDDLGSTRAPGRSAARSSMRSVAAARVA